MSIRKPLTADQRYELGIKRLQAKVALLRQRNPRPDETAKSKISYTETQLERMKDHLKKLRDARSDAAVYAEQIDTHGREDYSGALITANRRIQHYEGLAPTDADLIGATA